MNFAALTLLAILALPFAQGSSKLGEHGSEKMALPVQGSSGGVMATKI